jgi:multidrug resistance protein
MSRSPLLPIFLTVFVDVLGLTLLLPLLPFYALSLGASPFVATILGATYATCQLIAGPILGRISDRVGRKPVLIVSQVGTFAALLMIAGAHALWMLFVGRIIDGLTAGNLSIAQAYISDVTRPENRTRAFAVIGISFGMGFLVGPAISGIIAQHYGFAAPVYGAAALSGLSILLTIFLLPNQEELEAIKSTTAGGELSAAQDGPPAGARTLAIGQFFARPLARRRLFQFFLYMTSFATLTGGLALFLKARFGMDVQQVGYVFMVSGFMGAFIQGGLIGRLVKRFGEPRLAVLGFLSMAIGYPLLGLVGSVPQLIGVVCFSSFGVAVVRPCLTTLLTRSVGRREQGAILGTSQSLASISQMVGQPLAGFLIERGLLVAYGLAAAIFAFAGAVLTIAPEPAIEPER